MSAEYIANESEAEEYLALRKGFQRILQASALALGVVVDPPDDAWFSSCGMPLPCSESPEDSEEEQIPGMDYVPWIKLVDFCEYAGCGKRPYMPAPIRGALVPILDKGDGRVYRCLPLGVLSAWAGGISGTERREWMDNPKVLDLVAEYSYS